jgi:hypothetical protein
VKRGDVKSIVKLATFVLRGLIMGSLACAAGCSGSGGTPSQTNPAVKDFPKMGQAMQNSPESKINAMKTPSEKAAFLQEMANDSTFDPKLHTVMLNHYAKDPDADVAAAAKVLLDKAK